MDTLVLETVAALHSLPKEARRRIAVGLLDESASDLPVIEFIDPALDRLHNGGQTSRA